jgi:hypothetical protein
VFTIEPVPEKSLVVFAHDRFAVGRCHLWLPEGVTTDRGKAGAYPHGMTWRREGDALSQEASVDETFGPGNIIEVEPGVLECCGIRMHKEKPVPWRSWCRFGDDRVDFQLTVRNPHDETLPKVGAAVCFKFLDGEWWSDDVCLALTTEGVRSIAQLGRTGGQPNSFQAWLMEGESYDNHFYREFWGFGEARMAAPMWVSRCERAGCSVVITCDAAFFIHSNAGNPCTDLALRFGDLPPGATATRRGHLEFTTRGVEEILAAAPQNPSARPT